jgi:hypothetical protein
MTRWLVLAVLLAACSPGGARSAHPVAARTAPPPVVADATGGCGASPLHPRGAPIPDWASVNAPAFLPYVLGTPEIVLGYMFTPTLRSNGDNKILWYVKTPRQSTSLLAEGHIPGTSKPLARFQKEADSGPGEIYPSNPQAPAPGCWHFTLKWARSSAEVDLLFH